MLRSPVVQLCAVCLCWSSMAAAQPRTVRLTEPVTGPEPPGLLDVNPNVSLSADGVIVMFTSARATLVPGDTNDTESTVGTDVFIRHLPTGVTRRILGVGGAEPNGDAEFATLTSDGRYVFFVSRATNLVASDPNDAYASVFRHDLTTGITTLIDIPTTYVMPSGDGRYLAYHFNHLRLLDLQTGSNTAFLVDAAVSQVRFDGNGSIAAFHSSYVSGVYTGGLQQAFVFDRNSGTYELVSRRPDGAPGNGSTVWGGLALSDDGRYVAFVSTASDLVPGDTNGVADVFVRDRETDQTTRVSLLPGGGQRTVESLTVAISGDGSVVGFASSSVPACAGCPPRSEVAVYDRALADVQIVNVAWDWSPANEVASTSALYAVPALDRPGRLVAFTSFAGNLVLGDRNDGGDVFLRDRGLTPACTYQVSPAVVDVSAGGGSVAAGVATGAGCGWAFTSADGWVTSNANAGSGPAAVALTIAPNTGAARFGYAALGGRRILVRQPGPLGTSAPQFEMAGIGPTGQAFPSGTFAREISADGRYVAFAGQVGTMPNGYPLMRVYLRDRVTGSTTDVSRAPGGPANDSNIDHQMPGVVGTDNAVAAAAGATLSSDGRFLTFAAILPDGFTYECYVFDRLAGTSSRLPTELGRGATSGCPSMSLNGRYFTGFVATTKIVKLHDRSTQQTVSFTFPGLPSGDEIIGAASSVSARYVVVRVKVSGYCHPSQCQEYAVVLDRATGATVRTQNQPFLLGGAALLRLVEPAWVEFGLPRFNIRMPLSLTECDLIDRQTRQLTALPELLALQGGGCGGLAVNAGQQIVFSTLRDLAPGDTYQGTSDAHIYTRSTGVVSRIGARPNGDTYPVGFLTATPDGRYLLGQTATSQHTYSDLDVTNVVVFDLGVADATDSTAPTNLQATVTGTTVRLTWGPPSQGAPAAYVIEAGSSPGASNLATLDTGNSATTFTTPAPLGTYYVRVRARSGAAVGSPSNEIVVNVTGSCPMPSTPAGLMQTVNASSVQLSWQAAAGATSYVLEAGSSANSSNLLASDIGNTTTLSATAPPGTYYVRVRARNACGTGAPSNEVVVLVTGCAPTLAPATPSATVTNGVVSVTWGGVAGATGYVVEAGLSPGTSNAGVFQVSGTSLAGAAPPDRYYVRVRARNGCGVGPASSEIVIDVP